MRHVQRMESDSQTKINKLLEEYKAKILDEERR
jgi:hypothetical protein